MPEPQDPEQSLHALEQRISRLEHLRETELMQTMGLYQRPLRDAASVKAMVDLELAEWTAEQRGMIFPYLLEVPHFHVREWDYAGDNTPPGELFLPCWTVARFPDKDRCSVVYCDHGHAFNWGALEQDGWCSMDAVWTSSIKETVWRFRMLDGFAPGTLDLDSWLGPVRSLTSEEFADTSDLVLRLTTNTVDLGEMLNKVWDHYIVRYQAEDWKPASYLHRILKEVLSASPPEVQRAWEERVEASKPRP